MDVMGIVGRDGGYTKLHGDIVLVVPTVNADRVTPHTEAFQAVEKEPSKAWPEEFGVLPR